MTPAVDVVRTDYQRDGRQLRIVLDHPRGNVLTAGMVRAMREALAQSAREPRLKLMTFEGQGSDFSFGSSIEEHRPSMIGGVLPDFHALLRDLLQAPAPTLAVVRGRCLGGGFELALACDVIIAAEGAVMGLPEIMLGVFPPAGAALLPARVGAARAARAILTGEPIAAAEWRDAGLVADVTPYDDLDATVDRWFDEHLAPRSAAALRHAAAAARIALRALVEPALARAERLYLDDLMRTRDAAEGIEAYLQKRPPDWKNA